MGTSTWFTTGQGPSQNQTCFLGPGRLSCCQPRSLHLPPADFCAVLSVRSGSRTEKRSDLEHSFLCPVLSPWFQGVAVFLGLRYHGPQHLHIKAGQSVVDTLPSRAYALPRFASSPDERPGPEKQHPQSSWKRESGGPFLSLKQVCVVRRKSFLS